MTGRILDSHPGLAVPPLGSGHMDPAAPRDASPPDASPPADGLPADSSPRAASSPRADSSPRAQATALGAGQAVVARLNDTELALSFEFFPPRDEAGERQLWQTVAELEPYRPAFVSVTYGAGGSTRDATLTTAARLVRETTLTPMAHLTCVGHSDRELRTILDAYAEAGVHHVLALRGDPPTGPGTQWRPAPGGFSHAVELVSLAVGDGRFCVGVAAFPEGHREAPSLVADTAALRAKQDSGAAFAITDMFFRASDYVALLDRASTAGITLPIVPGLMPIGSLAQVTRMAALSGREVPSDVVARLERHADDPAALRAEGVEIAAEFAADLVAAGAPGLHFYTLNRAAATRQILSRLGLEPHRDELLSRA